MLHSRGNRQRASSNSGSGSISCSDFTKMLLLAMMVLLNVACSGIHLEPQPDDPMFAPVLPDDVTTAVPINGAIFQMAPAQAYRQVSFYQDRTARKVGDLLMIKLVENTSAKKETETEVKKGTDIKVPEPTLFQRVTDFGFQTTAGSELAFKGEADSDQKNSLQGSISVSVTEVLPNGILRVRGEKWIRLNRGDEYIRISGLVRPEDVSADNSVPSTKVADARIAYSQTGELAHANTMGWLSRFFNSPIWPF